MTTDGSAKTRIKYGTASWVYGEELEQSTAFWWSPDGKKLAYYRFDESSIPDYYLQIGQTGIYDTIDVEAYPKTGFPNPVVDVFVYDLATKQTTRIDVRDGKPFTNDVVGHYVYNVAWSPDGKELTFNRKNRRQNILELTGCDPTSGKCRADRPRRVADRLDRESRPRRRHAVALRQAALSLDARIATASRTTTSTTGPES